MHGAFVWYELITHDVTQATRFYAAVFDWTAAEMTTTGQPYTILSSGGQGLGGVMSLAQIDGGNDAPPHWLGYIACTDVDATAAAVREAGGSCCASRPIFRMSAASPSSAIRWGR